MEEAPHPEHFNPLQRFGRDVRQVRLARKLTQKHLGRATGYTDAYVCMVESGKLMASEKFAKGCDLAFGTGELFAGLRQRIDEGDHPSWFLPYLKLEEKASGIQNYSASLVMGLMQTEAYAHAVFRAAHPREEPNVTEGRVAARLRRRRIFDRENPPSLWVVLNEACLRTVVGGTETMAEQLEALLAAASSPHVDLQVLPFTAGAPGAHAKPFTRLTFDNAQTVLYADGLQGGRLYDSTKTVTLHEDSYNRLRAHALSPETSLAFIQRLLKEYAP